jgi:uncharacterized protein YjbI with pentapeptide repeats
MSVGRLNAPAFGGSNSQLDNTMKRPAKQPSTPPSSSTSSASDPAPKPKEPATNANGELEAQKLELEISKLKTEVSSGTRFEILKAIGTFLTSLGIIGTLWLGIAQQRQNRLSRDDERFERAVTRLGSSQVAERLTGLAGLRPFLQGEDQTRQTNALNYLVNAGVIEADPTVRSAIENLFDSISDFKLDTSVLDEGLTSARDRNRAVYNRASKSHFERQTEAKKRLVDEAFTEVHIGNPSQAEMAPLEISGKMIAGLVRAGASINDLSGIYCPNCSFSSREHPAKLVGVNFGNSILRRAEFIGANLDSASFHNADLILTNFIGAKLANAKFTADTTLEPWSVSAAVNSGELAASWGTIFACSDLSHADFTGRLTFILIYQNGVYGGNMRDEFYSANLTGTKFRGMRFAIATPVASNPSVHNNPSLPGDLSPMTNNSFSIMSDPIHYFKESTVTLWQYFGSEDADFKPLPNAYGRDISITMSSFSNASNLDKAELPRYARSYIDENQANLRPPLISYDCATGQKKADIYGMFLHGGPMTGNARF